MPVTGADAAADAATVPLLVLIGGAALALWRRRRA
jgi:MYXO-CTERM domain-containing protein